MRNITANIRKSHLKSALLISLALSSSLIYSLSENPGSKAFAADPALTAPGDDESKGNGGYPRVTSLEQQFLGKTFVNDPLATRVTRLETKKFGKVQTGLLVDRIDKLDELATPAPVPAGYQSADSESVDQPPLSASGQSGTVSTDSALQAAQESGDIGNYPRITELEQEFLGKVYKGEVVQTRLARLETKEFNKEYPEDALCDRVDRLDKKAKPKPKPQEGDEDATASSGKGGGAMGGIGKTLLGMFGGMGGGMMGGGVGGMGMGPGLMSGMGGMGSGMGMGRRGQSSQSNTPDPPSTPKASAPVNPFGPSGEDVHGAEKRTTVMEKFVFGKESASKPIEERVEKLEKKLVPYEHNTASKGINQRVDHLWTMLSAANSSSHSSNKEVPQ